MPLSDANFWDVKNLVEQGLSDYRIAALTGVARGTVSRWRLRTAPPRAGNASMDASSWGVADPSAYCYLLGVYLGDGHVTHKPPRTWTLRIACDRQYEHVIAQVRTAMEITFPERRSTRYPSSTGASDVIAICHPAVGRAFPQHGPGKKHLRPIVLTDWQLELAQAHPGALIRGLIHSDGCRVVNRFKTKLPSGRIAEYSYLRYFFSNLSGDIRQIFIDHCQLLGIRVTQSNHRNLTISHRKSVAILEELVGPKT
jgi:hypothetical protein